MQQHNETWPNISERNFSSYERLLHRYILSSYRSRNKGLLYGQLGSAIILYHVGRDFQAPFLSATADDLLDKALKDIPNNLPIGLATGLAGYCWGVEYLTYKQYIECIPNEVCESLILNIQKYNPLHLDYSLEGGLWGLLHYMTLHLANCLKLGVASLYEPEFLESLHEAAMQCRNQTKNRTLRHLCKEYALLLQDKEKVNISCDLQSAMFTWKKEQMKGIEAGLISSTAINLINDESYIYHT